MNYQASHSVRPTCTKEFLQYFKLKIFCHSQDWSKQLLTVYVHGKVACSSSLECNKGLQSNAEVWLESRQQIFMKVVFQNLLNARINAII